MRKLMSDRCVKQHSPTSSCLLVLFVTNQMSTFQSQPISRVAPQTMTASKRYKMTKPSSKKRVTRKPYVSRFIPFGFPRQIQMRHKYCETTNLAGALGVMGHFRIRVNGMFDPNITGTGHQPMYFDQLANLYDHYCVIGSKIELRFIPNSLSEEPIAYGCFINDDNSTTPTSINELIENSLAVVNYTAFGNDTPGILVNKWSAKKYFGKTLLSNTDLQGTPAANPNEQSYYNIFLQAVDLLSATSITVSVSIEYIAIWKELKDIAGS